MSHAIGTSFLNDMKRLGNQIPPDVGERAARNMRAAIAAAFPGPPALQTAAMCMIVANALGDLLSDIEPASPILSPSTDGRVQAVEEAFREVLRNAVRDRAVENHRRHLINTQGSAVTGR